MKNLDDYTNSELNEMKIKIDKLLFKRKRLDKIEELENELSRLRRENFEDEQVEEDNYRDSYNNR